MDFEKYTERSKGFVQAAQTLAQRSGHQQIVPEHLLKVLLDDKEGLAANLIRAAGGDPARALVAVEAALAKLPRVEGRGAGQTYVSSDLARLFDDAEKIATKAGDSFVTAERLLLALALDKNSTAGKALAAAGITAQNLNASIEQIRKGRSADRAAIRARNTTHITISGRTARARSWSRSAPSRPDRTSSTNPRAAIPCGL